jgi:hypothetical protein
MATPQRNPKGQFMSTTPTTLGSAQRLGEPGFYDRMDTQLVDGISRLLIATRKEENREHRIRILRDKVSTLKERKASLEIQLVLYQKVLETELGELCERVKRNY